MGHLTYDAVAGLSMVSSLLLFVAMFLAVIVYVFFFASRERLDQAQRTALDLKPEPNKSERRS